MSNKVILFADSDSQIFGALGHARSFSRSNWQVSFAIDKSQKIPHPVLLRISGEFEIIDLSMDQLSEYVADNDFDVVGVFSMASKLSRFRLDFEKLYASKSGKRPGIFTGFNGLSYEKFEEGLSWRFGYDAITLNGPRDQSLFYDFVGSSEWKKQPTVITGLAQVSDNKKSKIEKRMPFPVEKVRQLFVFAEQVVVPSSLTERRYLVAELIRIAEINKDWDVVVKCRIRPNEKTFHKTRFHLENILKEFRNLPDNLKLSYEPLPILFERASLFATISSTALFEALSEGIPSFVVSDYGVKTSFGTHVFIGSGPSICLAEIESLSELTTHKVEEKWLNWVGAKNVADNALVMFFEENNFTADYFETSFMTERKIQIWADSRKKYKYKSTLRYLLRLIGVFPRLFR